MSTPDALGVLEDFYAAERAYLAAGGPGEAGFDELASRLDPNVVIHQAPSLPYGGTWRGHRGMEKLLAAMMRAWESFDILEQEYMVQSDTAMVHSRVRARARATGRDLDFAIMQKIAVKDGLIVEFRQFYWDTAAVAEACS